MGLGPGPAPSACLRSRLLLACSRGAQPMYLPEKHHLALFDFNPLHIPPTNPSRRVATENGSRTAKEMLGDPIQSGSR